ncbi:hypothetical protein GGR54DRAFT_242467 [Hypoxylon sp. NC1633]|nr:hypothetical protein GGR54DRAFT_242467 [Hypoxylon sp. NC1633]
MWFRPLATLALLSSFALGQDLPGPGEPALPYDDGAFTEPTGGSYHLGSTLNVSWHTTYETSNLWLIVGWKFNNPIQLATNIGQNWYDWTVSTSSNNASEIYSFRVVNATGTDEQQSGGGFLSTAFLIDGLKSTSSSMSMTQTQISTAASAPVATSAKTSATAPAQTTDSAAQAQSSLTEGGKIGIGVGVGVGGVGLIALIAGIILFRRSKNRKTQAVDSMEPYSQTPQTFPSTPHTYVGSPNEYYKTPGATVEMEDTGRSAELDGGQGFGFTPAAYSDGTVPKPHPAELQG